MICTSPSYVTSLESRAIVQVARSWEVITLNTEALSKTVASAVEVVNRIVANRAGWGRALAHRPTKAAKPSRKSLRSKSWTSHES